MEYFLEQYAPGQRGIPAAGTAENIHFDDGGNHIDDHQTNVKGYVLVSLNDLSTIRTSYGTVKNCFLQTDHGQIKQNARNRETGQHDH